MIRPFSYNGNTRRMCAVWDYLLEHGPSTAADMAADMGIEQSGPKRALDAIRKKYPKHIRICAWRRCTYENTQRAGGGAPAAVYAFGSSRDIDRFKPFTSVERDRAKYLRNKALILATDRKRRRANGEREAKPLWLIGLL